MATHENKYTVNPVYQAAFDALQKKTIDFVRSDDKVNISIIETIQQLQHLMLIVKLHNKAEFAAESHQEHTPPSNNVDPLKAITAKSSIVEDIEKIIETYNQHFYNMDGISSATSNNLVKLATQDISDDRDMQWYREFLQLAKTEDADLTEGFKALRPLSDSAIAHGIAPEVVAPKVATTGEEISEREKVGYISLVCVTIFVYVLYNAFDVSKNIA